MADHSLQFIIPAQLPVEALKARLLRCFPFVDDGQTMRQRHYYDTFDWRFYRRALTLEEEHSELGRRIVLRDLHSGAVQRWVDHDEMPNFAAQLPRGPFRERLAAISSIRALLPVSELRSHTHVLRLPNKEKKTIARVEIELATVSGSDNVQRLTRRLQILPVRGYQKASAQLTRFAREQLKLKPARKPFLDDALAVVGRKSAVYPLKSRVKLRAREPAASALRRILSGLLDTVELNLPGTRQNIDTEFLHDLRVAVRRTRALIAQTKNVFGAEMIAPFRVEFNWLGTVTGPCRDLDVYLLGFDHYVNTLPPEYQPALEPVRRFLLRRHIEEQRRLVQWLDSPRFQALMINWRRFIETPPVEAANAPDAQRKLVSVANERIWHAYQRVRDKGRKIGPGTKAARLHRLRIHGKNLRYMIEFFRALYPREQIRDYLSELKNLQQNLGDFHDFHVQSLALSGFAKQMQGEQLMTPDTLAAIGILTDDLDQRQKRARQEFAEAFARFDRPRNRKLVRKLFRTRRRGAT